MMIVRKNLKLLLMIAVVPIVVALTLFGWICLNLVYASGLVLELISTIIALLGVACIIFSLFASSPPVVNPDAAAVTMVWSYIGELVFNMLVLVGAVKMADRVVREMMGL